MTAAAAVVVAALKMVAQAPVAPAARAVETPAGPRAPVPPRARVALRGAAARREPAALPAAVALPAAAGLAARPCSTATRRREAHPALKLVKVDDGFARPLTANSPDGDTARIFVGEQHAGKVNIIKNGSTLPTPFLDISDRVISGGNERGLLDIAFHPNFMQNGRFFVHYTADGTTASSGSTVVSEFTVSPPTSDTVDASTEKVLLTQAQPESNHNGGTLEFGPDGMLYIGLGDGGGANDQHGSIGNGQSTDTLLGKMLRIDVDGAKASGKEYGIPSGNMTGAGVPPELWAYGLRNPWRSTFDACTGDLYIADVGQGQWEEIDVQPKNVQRHQLRLARDGRDALLQPFEWLRPVRQAASRRGVSAHRRELQRHRRLRVPRLGHSRASRHVYLRGLLHGELLDLCLDRRRRDTEEHHFEINPGNALKQIVSFGQDASGELYVVVEGEASPPGAVYRIEAQ